MLSVKSPFSIKIALAGLCIALAGCATQPETPAEQPETKIEPVEPVVITKPFSADTLYALLVAELAGSRERYDIALNNYLQQAEVTKDLGITRRAALIANFLKQHQAALAASRLWVNLDPTDLKGRSLLTTELARDGQLEDAIDQSLYLLRQEGETQFRGIASAASGRDKALLERLKNKMELALADHENADLLTGLSLIAQQLGESDKSLEYIDRAVTADPNNLTADVIYSRLLVATGNQEAAIVRLAELVEDNDQNKPLKVEYARTLTKVDLNRARDQFEDLVIEYPDDTELKFSLGLVYFDLRAFDAAKPVLLESTKDTNRASTAYFYLGQIAEAEQQWNDALKYYIKVNSGKDILPALYNTTELLIRGDQVDVARKRLASARGKLPANAEQLYLMEAEALARHGYGEDSLQAFNSGLVKFPMSVPLYYSRSLVREQQGDFVGTEQDLNKVLELEPNNVSALNALGYTLANRTDRLDEAYQLIYKAYQARPDDAAIIDSMGWILYRQGKNEEALTYLRRAMSILPDHEIAAHLGELLWVTGKYEEARQVWQQGLEAKPDSEIIQSTMQRLLNR